MNVRRWIAASSLGLMIAGGGAVAALAQGPDPNGPAKYGLCTAYFASETGREHGNAGDAPPFQNLADAAEENDESIEDFCSGTRPGNRGDDDNSNAPDPVR